ncbi:hypothetical protein HK096_008499, partial [Nowakowskiella sp. JEL0078]
MKLTKTFIDNRIDNCLGALHEKRIYWMKSLQTILLNRLSETKSQPEDYNQFSKFVFHIAECLLMIQKYVLIDKCDPNGTLDSRRFNAVVSVQILIVAKLARLNPDLVASKIVKLFVEAVKNLEVTHGRMNDLCKESVEILEEEKLIL